MYIYVLIITYLLNCNWTCTSSRTGLYPGRHGLNISPTPQGLDAKKDHEDGIQKHVVVLRRACRRSCWNEETPQKKWEKI